MRRRRRRSRRSEAKTRHHLLNGALAVWAGVVTVALLLQQRPDDRTGAMDAAIPVPGAESRLDSAQNANDRQALQGAPAPDSMKKTSDARDGVSAPRILLPEIADTAGPLPKVLAQARNKPQIEDATPMRPIPAEPVSTEPSARKERPRVEVAEEPASPKPALDTDIEVVEDTSNEPPADSGSDIAPFEGSPEGATTSSVNIARAQFTTGIEDREPVDRVESVPLPGGEPISTLYYFTLVTGMSGETVTHRWEYEGAVMAEVTFDIGSDSWRTWSSKDLTPAMEGDWRVVVTDAQGNALKTDSFSYQGP